jgi:hypothetical protein
VRIASEYSFRAAFEFREVSRLSNWSGPIPAAPGSVVEGARTCSQLTITKPPEVAQRERAESSARVSIQSIKLPAGKPVDVAKTDAFTGAELGVVLGGPAKRDQTEMGATSVEQRLDDPPFGVSDPVLSTPMVLSYQMDAKISDSARRVQLSQLRGSLSA